jgi:hypothetical protein
MNQWEKAKRGLADRIESAIESQGLTKADIRRKLARREDGPPGSSPHTFDSIVSRKTAVIANFLFVQYLAQILNVRSEWLLTGRGSMYPNGIVSPSELDKLGLADFDPVVQDRVYRLAQEVQHSRAWNRGDTLEERLGALEMVIRNVVALIRLPYESAYFELPSEDPDHYRHATLDALEKLQVRKLGEVDDEKLAAVRTAVFGE